MVPLLGLVVCEKVQRVRDFARGRQQAGPRGGFEDVSGGPLPTPAPTPHSFSRCGCAWTPIPTLPGTGSHFFIFLSLIRTFVLQWRLLVEPEHGWAPKWEGPLIAMVVVLSAILAVLLFSLLISRCGTFSHVL